MSSIGQVLRLKNAAAVARFSPAIASIGFSPLGQKCAQLPIE
tara:strand:+ start:596 stop:721 length:126 start_codon:yes stop_codon:yes gene_type:complete